MLEIVTEDIKGFKKCIDAIVNLVKEGAFEVDVDGIKLRAMDPSQIAMVIFTMPASSFQKYTVDSKVRVGINLENLGKILGRSRSKERMTIKMNEASLNIIFEEGNNKRSFKIPMIDVPPGPSKDLKINYTSVVKLKGKLLKDILQDVALLSPHVLLVADTDKFRVEANSENGEAFIEYKNGEGVEVSTQRITSAVFSQEYLNDIIKGCDDEEDLILNLGAPTSEDPRPKPLSVRYKLHDASFLYYLAPRIETE